MLQYHKLIFYYKVSGVMDRFKENSLILEMGAESVEIRFDNIAKAKERY